MAEPTIAEQQEQWSEVAGQILDGMLKRLSDYQVVATGEAALTEGLGTLVGIVMRLTAPIGIGLAKGMTAAENVVAPAFAEMAAAAVRDLFGTSVDASAFSGTGNRGGRGAAANALGRGLIDQIKGQSSELQPSDEAAAKYLSVVTQMALEDWYRGWLFEVLSSLTPYIDVGKIENFASLGDKVAGVLGLSRITRRVLSPIVDASIVTPLRWQTNKTYRPELLSPSEIARQVARGVYTREEGLEELARLGYNPRRSEALLNAARKFFSASDVRTFVNREYWTRDQGITHLKDQGYDEQAALDALRLEGLRRIDQLEDALASSLVAAYADGRIDRSEFGGLLTDAVSVASERALLTELAETRRMLNRRRLSLSQVEAMVKSGVASVLDYREAARRDGYPEGDVTLLELQLRYELDKATDIAEHRRRVAEERAAEQERRAAAADARRREVEAERARQQRGPIAKLERAAVRGLIPLSRVEEVLAAEYDAETVGILLDLVEADRVAYIEQQERAARAETGARDRGLNLSELRAALFAEVITLGEFRARLSQLGLSDSDTELLTATAGAELAARLEANQRRTEATGAASRRRIDLPRFETLVRRGARTIGQYDALLADLGFDEPDRAAMVELLQLKIADDAAARAKREEAAAALRQRGLSLDQFERAVILGTRTIDDYARFLLDQGFTTDAQVDLLALLRARVEEANAARARRQATGEGSGGLTLSLATVRRAARLGVISPDGYVSRLAAAGYDQDDIAIDLELLLLEIADVQATRARREEADRAAAERNLSLADVEQAVKRGLAPIEAYRARAAELGFSGEELDLLVELLADELRDVAAARARRAEIDGQLRPRNLTVGQLEEAVRKGFSDLSGFRDELLRLGFGLDDAELLAALLAVDLESGAGAAEGQTE